MTPSRAIILDMVYDAFQGDNTGYGYDAGQGDNTGYGYDALEVNNIRYG